MFLKLKSVVLFFKILTCFLLPRPFGNKTLIFSLLAKATFLNPGPNVFNCLPSRAIWLLLPLIKVLLTGYARNVCNLIKHFGSPSISITAHIVVWPCSPQVSHSSVEEHPGGTWKVMGSTTVRED